MASGASPQIAELFIPELKDLLARKNFAEIKSVLKTISLVDLADVWERFSQLEQILLFRLLSGREATSLFQELDPPQQSHILNSLGNKELEGLLDDFNPEEAARVFHELPERTVRHLFSLLEREQRQEVHEIFKYPDNSVGSWLRIQHVDLKPNLTTAQAMERIRTISRLRQGGGPDGYYVTDKRGRVAGFVTLRELIAAPPKMPLKDYMSPVRILQIDPYKDQEEAAYLFKRYKPSTAPIVDKDGKLLGYIQAEDIIPLIEEEVSEDIAKMAGTAAAEFKSESIWQKARIRFPWLIATCAGQILVALVIHKFNFVLSRVIAMASFSPFIAAMGGNVGSQTSMILVRALALREYDFSDRWKVLIKETSTGILLGLIYGSVIVGLAMLIYGSQFGTVFPFVVGLATIASMTVATAMGVVWPLTLVRFNIDPATATGPLISTSTDLFSTTVYFLLALWLLI